MEKSRPSNKLMYIIVSVIMILNGFYSIYQQASAIDFMANTDGRLNGLFTGTIVIYIVIGVLQIIVGIVGLVLLGKLGKQHICMIMAAAIIILIFLNSLLSYYYYQVVLGTGAETKMLSYDIYGQLANAGMKYSISTVVESCIPVLFFLASLQNKLYWNKHLKKDKNVTAPAPTFGEKEWQNMIRDAGNNTDAVVEENTVGTTLEKEQGKNETANLNHNTEKKTDIACDDASASSDNPSFIATAQTEDKDELENKKDE